MSRPPFGIVNINKSKYVTSRAVVNVVQRLIKPAKAGHAGTLDPMATGVVLVCVGRATRLVSRIQRLPKTYRTTFIFGQTSDTDDATGTVQTIDAVLPSRSDIESLLPDFTGEIEQVPPAYSAVHIDGKRAYKLARRGEDVRLKSKQVTVSRFELLRFDGAEAEFEIECGSGTYIRSLARDMGQRLGCGGLMSELERTQVGPFTAAAGLCPGGGADPRVEVTLADVTSVLVSPLLALPGIPRRRCSDSEAELVRRGHAVSANESLPRDIDVALLHRDEFIAVGQTDCERMIRPKVVFHAIQ